MTERMDGQITLFDQDIWCSRTCRESSAPTTEATSEWYSNLLQESQMTMPLFLDLRAGTDGQTQGQYWQIGGALLGEFIRRSFGEHPREDVDCALLQILQDNPPQKYYLSAEACEGMLNRTQKRGRHLPNELRDVLVYQSKIMRKAQ